MEIVIAFQERSVGSGDYREEEGGRAEMGGDGGDSKEEVFEDGVPDSELCVLVVRIPDMWCAVKEGGNGKGGNIHARLLANSSNSPR